MMIQARKFWLLVPSDGLIYVYMLAFVAIYNLISDVSLFDIPVFISQNGPVISVEGSLISILPPSNPIHQSWPGPIHEMPKRRIPGQEHCPLSTVDSLHTPSRHCFPL